MHLPFSKSSMSGTQIFPSTLRKVSILCHKKNCAIFFCNDERWPDGLLPLESESNHCLVCTSSIFGLPVLCCAGFNEKHKVKGLYPEWTLAHLRFSQFVSRSVQLLAWKGGQTNHSSLLTILQFYVCLLSALMCLHPVFVKSVPLNL